jgi:cytochrome c553
MAVDLHDERAWRTGSVAVVIGIIAVAALIGFVVLPVLEERPPGVDAFTAICRALGLQPGSPGARQPVSNAKAQPVSQVAWTIEVIDRLRQPNAVLGNETAAVCAGCHGEKGISPAPQFPNMAGQSAFAIYKQLHDFKSGARLNDLMAGIAQTLAEDQMIAVAAHFAALTRGTLDPQAAAVDDPDILRLTLDGDPTRGLPACAACHGTRAGGPIETPTLAGQRPEYLLAQLEAYAKGERHNDVYARMRGIAVKLKPDEMARVARYYAGLR